MPKSTEDVSEIVKITNEFNVSISVRSGGHSYTCTSIRQGEILLAYFQNCVKLRYLRDKVIKIGKISDQFKPLKIPAAIHHSINSRSTVSRIMCKVKPSYTCIGNKFTYHSKCLI